MNILLAGAAGALGKAILQQLKSGNPVATPSRIDAVDLRPADGIRAIDLSRETNVDSLVSELSPDLIINTCGTFSQNLEIDFSSNVLISQHLLNAVRKIGRNTRVLLIGSAAEYGSISPGDNPVREDHPLEPGSIYGLTKVMQHQLMQYHFRMFGTPVIMARPFNLLGKGLSTKLFAGNLLQQIDEVKAGLRKRISLGYLGHRRDYLSIEDAARDILIVATRGKPGRVYNVCRGESESMQDILRRVLTEHGLEESCVDSQPLPGGSVGSIVPDIYGDRSRFEELLHHDN